MPFNSTLWQTETKTNKSLSVSLCLSLPPLTVPSTAHAAFLMSCTHLIHKAHVFSILQSVWFWGWILPGSLAHSPACGRRWGVGGQFKLHSDFCISWSQGCASRKQTRWFCGSFKELQFIFTCDSWVDSIIFWYHPHSIVEPTVFFLIPLKFTIRTYITSIISWCMIQKYSCNILFIKQYYFSFTCLLLIFN